MTDPYRVLGVEPSATDEQVKRAYRELARKYHPDNYQNNPLADLAEEKMKEINEAYDQITKERAGGGQSYQSGGYQGSYQSASNAGGQGSHGVYQQVRQAINLGDLNRAEQLLRTAPAQNGEWHFLMGSIAYRKGWLDEAMQHYQTACYMDPSNGEYRQALARMQQGGQAYQPYGYGGGMDACDCCAGLMCLNCLCGGCN
ncbi:DnaJ domain-containing protein [Pseudoflavonifractor phocaeensis]|uniref:J domain-containing protein n=1 Tax=Pseudoflavonifractor phocaeensis TaxID=1870988 RepID=UPI00195DD2D4|nr:J domain-containing protein [Pseudoflavonifractor phocaeensis]MBM6869579.1 DnaJ domain-containing protein [Pseudoflavonifractor phocaeensis]MBM6938583.1 DnaJ domain-containing protein [Pseudoflavonifractor phocaeensis]